MSVAGSTALPVRHCLPPDRSHFPERKRLLNRGRHRAIGSFHATVRLSVGALGRNNTLQSLQTVKEYYLLETQSVKAVLERLENQGAHLGTDGSSSDDGCRELLAECGLTHKRPRLETEVCGNCDDTGSVAVWELRAKPLQEFSVLTQVAACFAQRTPRHHTAHEATLVGTDEEQRSTAGLSAVGYRVRLRRRDPGLASMPNGTHAPDDDWDHAAVLEFWRRSFFSQYHDHVLDCFDEPILNKSELSQLLHGSFKEICASTVPASPMEKEVEESLCKPKYRLKFTHECMATACGEEDCSLCENNPKKRCGSQCFKPKYFMNETLAARCGALPSVCLVDVRTNEIARLDAKIEACILNGLQSARRFQHGIPSCGAEGLEACQMKWAKEQGVALLQSPCAANNISGKVEFRLKGGEAELPKLKVMHSSEALLGSRKAPFRLFVCVATPGDVDPGQVIPAVTTDFVVATQRSKLAQKKDVPLLPDQLCTLEQMGGQRVQTLDRLGEALMKQLKLEELPPGWQERVRTVDDFLKLAQTMKVDSRLKKKVFSILRMSEAQWNEACDHAAIAVPLDDRRRMWRHPNGSDPNAGAGLLYGCTLGEVDLSKPQALVDFSKSPHRTIRYDTALPGYQEKMQVMHLQAKEHWLRPRHPGWCVYPSAPAFSTQDFQQDAELMPAPSLRCGPIMCGNKRKSLGDCDGMLSANEPMMTQPVVPDFYKPIVATGLEGTETPVEAMAASSTPSPVDGCCTTMATVPTGSRPLSLMPPKPPTAQWTPAPETPVRTDQPAPSRADRTAPLLPTSTPYGPTSLDVVQREREARENNPAGCGRVPRNGEDIYHYLKVTRVAGAGPPLPNGP
eukprot:evm.model.scf_1658.2 EVM.evm.TU.scf_1658.2   scf_1658:9428-22485(-)